MRRLVVKQGYVKLWRLGPIEFGEQSRWARAPQRKGLWAFPYPFFDLFFAYHKYTDLLPKRLQDGSNYDEQTQWINTVGRKILPIREFWYKGNMFTHFTPNGKIGDTGLFNPDDVHWSVMDSTKFAQFVASTGGNKELYRYGDDLEQVTTSVDHLEVFISPGVGRIRDRL